ncbi:hypothetical protein MBM_00421 [Drepanopeziza brunnea f. sp. 'multigermtubi' MB_m1]|uniref:Uncharacterized protein n=1 Tax=Marssonina brunnea f. sp. multigermtubi (strain MB_m1) TaxID=1072389 RepID=K1XL37_MARBU|nr:uncharacterized protein MBM_00421 [Drepanopeziza brunnea f. sp. 'multigermtubi' MB_m1]EKD21308.1 hypothetical protein MBM_00421 [Drepanopeziza brunnea f. sp. 'multigermtubi' MB_m1]
MPFNELQRCESWPPTVVRLHSDVADRDSLDAIDDDPFSFFLTSPEDIEDFLEEDFDLSAGIETPESKSPVREVSPSAIQRVPLEPEDEDGDDGDVTFGLAIPLSLKAFTRKHNLSLGPDSGRKSRMGHRQSDRLKGLGIALESVMSGPDAKRGRANVKPSPRVGGGRGRGQTRSLPRRRKQSWKVPSPEIWVIKEERESGSEEEEALVSASAPATGRVEQEPTKPRKRVHWAI